MKKWLRRIRGGIGMGVTWAAAWFGVGAIISSVIWVVSGSPVGFVANSVLLAMAGFVGGAIFSTVLGITEGRRSFHEMSLPRFAGWGALGGFILSALLLSNGQSSISGMVTVVGVVTLMGAGSAAGSLALARRADDRELLDAGADAGDVGLTQEEKHALLGE